jgi:rhamnose utilization protein RhaD (predicted bifunctional aldolase and dehydrogenase)
MTQQRQQTTTPARPADFPALADLSAALGADMNHVQGGGGNASLKHDDVMWIKASGTWLANANDQDIFVPVRLHETRQDIETGEQSPGARHILGGSRLRPSIETSLHALLPHRVVIHTHSVNAIAWAIRQDGREALNEHLRDFNWAWIDYARPGVPLTNLVRQVIESRAHAPDILVLANHGLVAGAESVDALAHRVSHVERFLDVAPRAAQAARPGGAMRACLEAGNWRNPSDPLVHSLAVDSMALAAARRGVLYPDHVVFLGGELPVTETGCERVMADMDALPEGMPPYAVFPNEGVLVHRDIVPGAEAMLDCLARVCLRVQPSTALRYLKDTDVAELSDWEAEKYRQKLAKQLSN